MRSTKPQGGKGSGGTPEAHEDVDGHLLGKEPCEPGTRELADVHSLLVEIRPQVGEELAEEGEEEGDPDGEEGGGFVAFIYWRGVFRGYKHAREFSRVRDWRDTLPTDSGEEALEAKVHPGFRFQRPNELQARVTQNLVLKSWRSSGGRKNERERRAGRDPSCTRCFDADSSRR